MTSDSVLKNHFTLITGASSGIGWELAYEYAKNGHPLILTARTTAKLNELKADLEKKYNAIIQVITCDLSKTNSAQKLFDEIKTRGLKVNGLVNNAGFGDHCEFSKSSLTKNLEMIQLNVTSLVELTQILIPDLLKNSPSKIMNVASTASFLPGPLMAVYYGTKAFVLSFSESLNQELKQKNISVTALCPGPTTSGFQEIANFSNMELLEKIKFPTSQEVARYAYDKTMKKQAVAIHGVLNNIMVFVTRLMPRFMVRKIVHNVQMKRKQ
jgi:uncharacterized protein